MHLEPNNCVLLLNDLEERGLGRAPAATPRDRRRHIVVADRAAAARPATGAEVKLETVEDDVLAALSADEREQLRDLLGRALEGANDPVLSEQRPTAAAGR